MKVIARKAGFPVSLQVMKMFLAMLLLAGSGGVRAEAAQELELLGKFLERQARVKTLAADFSQERALRVLKDPVSMPGRIWFRAPSSFRWEVGEPIRMLALGTEPGRLLLVEPGRKRARWVDGGRDAAMMDFRLAHSVDALEKRFQIASVRIEREECRVILHPRLPDEKRFLDEIDLAFAADSLSIRSFQMVFRDGSSFRNDFLNVRVDERLPEGIFAFDLAGYDVTDARR